MKGGETKMNNQNTLIDYDSESKKLTERVNINYWNPKQGKFEVVALSELSKYQQTEKDGTMKEKARIDIEVVSPNESKGQYVWTMSPGQTQASLYGQLINLAKSKSNKLLGQKFTVVIKNDGTKRDFTIV